MEKQANRSRKIEEIHHILKPLIYQCEWENETIDEKRFKYILESNLIFDYFNIDSTIGVVFITFVNEHPKLQDGIDEHDNLVKKLINEINYFLTYVITDNFRSRVKKKIIEFDVKQGRKNNKFGNSTITYYCNAIVDCLIENLDINDNYMSGDIASFWKEFGNEFIRMKKDKEFKEKLEQLYSISLKLKEKNNLMLKQLKVICKEYLEEGLSLGLDKKRMIFES